MFKRIALALMLAICVSLSVVTPANAGNTDTPGITAPAPPSEDLTVLEMIFINLGNFASLL
jgi:hypothetical protein